MIREFPARRPGETESPPPRQKVHVPAGKFSLATIVYSFLQKDTIPRLLRSSKLSTNVGIQRTRPANFGPPALLAFWGPAAAVARVLLCGGTQLEKQDAVAVEKL